MERTALPEMWSVSAIQNFLRCPAAYYFGRVVGLDAEEESPALALGSALHAAQAFALSRLKSVGLPSLEHMREVFVETFDLSVGDPRFAFAEGEAEALRQDGLAYCEVLHASYADIKATHVVAIEQEFVVPLIDPVTGEQLRPLKGVMDLVLRDDEGVVTVADLKSAKSKLADQRLRHDLQATLYAHAAHLLWGGTGWFRFDVMLKQRKPSLDRVEVLRGPEDFRRAFAVIKNVEAAIRASYFAPAAEGGWQCSGCGHRSACRDWHLERLPSATKLARVA